jgi:hypothetical protein
VRSIFLLFVSPCCPRGCDDVCVSLSMVVFLPWLSVWRSFGVFFSSFFFPRDKTEASLLLYGVLLE